MWPRLKNSPHTYAHEGLESIFLFEFIELQWVQTDFLRLSDNNNSQRMLNALEVGTKVPIHRHLETSETTVCLQGCMDVVFYDLRPNEDCGGPFMGDCGTVIADGMETNVFERYRVRLCPREGKYGVQIPLGAWHSVEVYEPSTIFEAKDGAYKP